MTHPVSTGHLSADRLEQAWPLVREIAGSASLEGWRAFAHAMIMPVDPSEASRGIVVTERHRTIRGLVTYEVVPDLSLGRVLLLRNAVVLDLSMGEAIALALHAFSLEIAERAECAGLCLEVTPPMAWIGDAWRRRTTETGSLPMKVARISDAGADRCGC